MINEQLYMSSRIFRMFCEQYHMDARSANSLFNEYDVWNYIESAYGMLHLNGDESALSDIRDVMMARGANI